MISDFALAVCHAPGSVQVKLKGLAVVVVVAAAAVVVVSSP